MGIKFDKLFDVYAEMTHLSLIYPFDDMCILSQKPVEIHMKSGLLHKDGGMAVRYADGFGLYSLNGVKVPEYLAITRDSDLSIDFFLKESNADVKAEFLKKYGMDRMVKHGKMVDSHEAYEDSWYHSSEYKLIDMGKVLSDAGYQVKYAPYLYMRNHTTGTYHLEGVHPSCKTLQEALMFRMGEKEAYKIGGIK